MNIAFFNTKPYDRESFDKYNLNTKHSIKYLEARLNVNTVELAHDCDVVCCFVSDVLSKDVLVGLKEIGIKLIALRCAGYNNLDLEAANALELPVVRVPNYSPYAVAEHATAMILSLNRKVHKSYMRVRDSDFSLHGLMGFDLHGKTVGVIGIGRIGSIFAKIMLGFGCRVLGYELVRNPKHPRVENVEYVSLDKALKESDIVSLHCPLVKETHHMINKQTVALMKRGVMLINTSRGELIDTRAVVDGLKTKKIGYLGLDVYEKEGNMFFENLSEHIIHDDLFARLQSFPNVLITSHQAFFTREALRDIAKITLDNISAFAKGHFVKVL